MTEKMDKVQMDRNGNKKLPQAQLQEKVDELASRLSRIQFDYSDPVKGFDRSKVKGLVAELLELKDTSTATALEVTAGGSLYSVVVDSDTTGKMLLKNGKLKKRVFLFVDGPNRTYRLVHDPRSSLNPAALAAFHFLD